ncbi:MAG: cysteine desulfurase [Clostridia bacterium]|nr:cysteine desulfurase [Clostridia bacterium]
MRKYYFDHAATAPIRPEAADAACEAMKALGNPSSTHSFGQKAHAMLDRARAQAAALINAPPECVFFTSGGTEAINWAVFGTAWENKKGHMISSAIEHHAALHAAEKCADLGMEVDFVKPNNDGVVLPDAVAAFLKKETKIVSVMTVNNETGAVNPISEIAALCKKNDIRFFTDAVQAVGHIPVDARGWGVDLLAAAGHKFGGPMGVGFLYIAPGVELPPFHHGGGHEGGRRAGTENMPGIVGLGVAAELALAELGAEEKRLRGLRLHLKEGIAASIDNVAFNGNDRTCAPGILSVTFKGAHSEALHMDLDMIGFAASLGSACGAGMAELSHVLEAMDISGADMQSTIRFSMGGATTQEDVDALITVLPEIVRKRRVVSNIY